MSRLLPPARHEGHYAVSLVCLGNICRSPMAHVVLEQALADAGLADVVGVVSSGTGGWHVGGTMDPRAAATLTAHGYDATRHRARQFATEQWADLDLVLAMDRSNLADLTDLGPEPGRLMLFCEDAEVPDPYYGGDAGFAEVLELVERTSADLVAALRDQRPWARTAP